MPKGKDVWMKSKWLLDCLLHAASLHDLSTLSYDERLYLRMWCTHRYEKLLKSIELNREALSGINNGINQFCAERTKANEEMRVLERPLVEILFDQQKKLLEISSRVVQEAPTWRMMRTLSVTNGRWCVSLLLVHVVQVDSRHLEWSVILLCLVGDLEGITARGLDIISIVLGDTGRGKFLGDLDLLSSFVSSFFKKLEWSVDSSPVFGDKELSEPCCATRV